MTINGYDDGEERDRMCEMWKEKKGKLEKWVSNGRILTLIVWVKLFRVWVSIYIKELINWFSIFGMSLGMSSGLRVDTYILITRPHTHFSKSKKTQMHTQTQSKHGKSVNLSLVQVGIHVY